MTQNITYKINIPLDLDAVIDVYRSCALGVRRPVDDRARMAKMLEHANLIVTAWDGDYLVGLGRSFTDYSCITYMHCLAVRDSHQKRGIGKEIIRQTQLTAGPNASFLLTAAPSAEKYYPHIGFAHVPQAWILPAQDKLEFYRSIGATTRTVWEPL